MDLTCSRVWFLSRLIDTCAVFFFNFFVYLKHCIIHLKIHSTTLQNISTIKTASQEKKQREGKLSKYVCFFSKLGAGLLL